MTSKTMKLALRAAEKRRRANRIALFDEAGTLVARTTLDDFLTSNDGFSAEEIIEMRKLIASGKQYRGGGGASPEWTIQPDRRRVG